jgi:hypothetical protein
MQSERESWCAIYGCNLFLWVSPPEKRRKTRELAPTEFLPVYWGLIDVSDALAASNKGI